MTPRPVRSVALVYNPVAGQGRRRPSVERVCKALEAAGGDVELFPTRAAGDGIEQARLAASKHALVAVLGGDGSVNEALNGVILARTLAGNSARILLLPGGTMNVLCRDLGVPLNAERAAALLATGTPRRLSLGLVRNSAGEQRYFALMIGAGIDASVVHHMTEHPVLKKYFGPWAFFFTGLGLIGRYKFPKIDVCAEDGDTPGIHEGRAAVVGKSRGYGGWFTVTGRAHWSEPIFELALARKPGAIRHLANLHLAFFNQLKLSPGYNFLMAKRLRLSSRGVVPVQMDGDAWGCLPLDVSIDGTTVEVLMP